VDFVPTSSEGARQLSKGRTFSLRELRSNMTFQSAHRRLLSSASKVLLAGFNSAHARSQYYTTKSH
jgi:hypothetical protein